MLKQQNLGLQGDRGVLNIEVFWKLGALLCHVSTRLLLLPFHLRNFLTPPLYGISDFRASV